VNDIVIIPGAVDHDTFLTFSGNAEKQNKKQAGTGEYPCVFQKISVKLSVKRLFRKFILLPGLTCTGLPPYSGLVPE
jgi:hypothetical protein